MAIGVWVLGDQLSQGQAALASLGTERCPVVLIESWEHCAQRRYHRQKLVLVWSAMRHFAAELEQAGWPVTYATGPDFLTPLKNWITTQGITTLRMMMPNDRPFATWLQALPLPCPLELLPNNQFLWSTADFHTWATGRKQLRLEHFYREGRKRTGLLMMGKDPIGGEWNYDSENRQPPKAGLQPPAPLTFAPDPITAATIAAVEALPFPTYGQARPFGWAVTRSQALAVLDHFITTRLPSFGPYQDAMVTGADTLWHALLSPYLNLGLLHPQEVLTAAAAAHQAQDLPLNSVEGFIRQVLGWREYMRGLYWWVEDDYAQGNWFDHQRPLPEFFWTGETPMNCLSQTLSQIQRTGYAHHIQRLMVLSNFALIAGLNPQAVEDWFHSVFIDAYDWVMQTNVLGMGLFADGGVLASKPYAASGNYIHRMSDYCRGCAYDPRQRTGDRACPFNYLYWDFLDRHRAKLQTQGRMSFILKNLDRMAPAELQEVRDRAARPL